ncbi:hypothetical protein, partial [Microbacterium sp.]|uniref:hypothetical protein n=1 Tax=Microbacterium sp. TaxID=51671 RepID=UPI003C761320
GEDVPGALGRDDAWITAVIARVANRLGGPELSAEVAEAVTAAALLAHADTGVTLIDQWRAGR